MKPTSETSPIRGAFVLLTALLLSGVLTLALPRLLMWLYAGGK